MGEVTQIIGIDVSKDKFDVFNEKEGHSVFDNSVTGFKAFLKKYGKTIHCVMEATGCYYQQLATYLYTHGAKVTVINPVVGKRFIQMNLQHNKTDKVDAMMLYKLGTRHPLSDWRPEPEELQDCRLINNTLTLYFKHQTALKIKLHNLETRGRKSGALVASIKRQLERLKKEIQKLEKEVEELVKIVNQPLLTNLRTIPGIGPKAGVQIIAYSGGLQRFENHKQLSAFFGLDPTERSSGTSVRGRSKISKRGNPLMRKQLFLSSFMASQHNPQCKALYDRIVNKGKSKKLALIAVANKLLAQALAISKSGIPYDPDYKSTLNNN